MTLPDDNKGLLATFLASLAQHEAAIAKGSM